MHEGKGKQEEDLNDDAGAAESTFETMPFLPEEDTEQIAKIRREEIQVQPLELGESAKYTFTLTQEPASVEKTFNGEIFAPGFGYSINESQYALSDRKAVSLLWEHYPPPPTNLNVLSLKNQYYKACAHYPNQSDAKQRKLRSAYDRLLKSINKRFIEDHDLGESISLVNAKIAQVADYLKSVLLEKHFYIEYEHDHKSATGVDRPQVFYSKGADDKLHFESLNFSVRLDLNESRKKIPAVVTVDADSKVTVEVSESPLTLKEEDTDHIAVEKVSIKALDAMRMQAMREYINFVMQGDRGWRSDLTLSRIFDDVGKRPLTQELKGECPTYVYLETHRLGFYPSWMSAHVRQIDALLAEHGFVEGTRQVMAGLTAGLMDSLNHLLFSEEAGGFSQELYTQCKKLYQGCKERKLIHQLRMGFVSKFYRDAFQREYSEGKPVYDSFAHSLPASVLDGYLSQALVTRFFLEPTQEADPSEQTDFSENALSQLVKTHARFDSNADEGECVEKDILAAWVMALNLCEGIGFTAESHRALVEFCSEHKLLEHPETAAALSEARQSKGRREAIYKTIVTNKPVSMVSLVAYFDFTLGSDIRKALANIDGIDTDNMGHIPKFENLSTELQRNDRVVRQYEALALLESLKEKAKSADNDPEDPRYGADFQKDAQIVLHEIKALRNPKIALETTGRQVIHSKPLRDAILERATAIFECHDGSASRLKRLWRSFKAKLPWNSADKLKQKRKTKFLAKYTAFHPKDKKDLGQQILAEIKSICDAAAEEISTAKSLDAIQEAQNKATGLLSSIGAHSGLVFSFQNRLGRERSNAITAVVHMGELCRMPFLQAAQYYDYVGEPIPDEADAQEPWTLKQRLLTGCGEGEAHECGLKETSLRQAADYYEKIPEDLRPKFTPVKEAVEKQITAHAQQRFDELNAYQKLEGQQALWKDIQEAIVMDIDVPLLVDALSKLASVLYYPSKDFEARFNTLLNSIPEAQAFAFTSYYIRKLIAVRNGLNYIIENKPIDHTQFSEVERLKAKAMAELLNAIFERYALNAGDEQIGENHDHIHTDVLAYFGFQPLRLSSAGIQGYQALITEQLGNKAQSYFDGMNHRGVNNGGDCYIGMTPHEKEAVTVLCEGTRLPGGNSPQEMHRLKEAVEASLAEDLSNGPNDDQAVTFVSDAVKCVAKCFCIDKSVAHTLMRSGSSAQGYPPFDEEIRRITIDQNHGAVKTLASALASAYTNSEIIPTDIPADSDLQQVFEAGDSKPVNYVELHTNSSTSISEKRALSNGVLQHQELQNIDRLLVNGSVFVTRDNHKPFMLLKKVFHIVPVPEGDPKVQLVDYQLYPLHPVAHALVPMLDRASSATAGINYFEPAKENQFNRRGVINPINFEEKLLGQLKAAAKHYLIMKGHPVDDESGRENLEKFIENSRGHKATYQACLVLQVVKVLEDNKDIVAEADYKAAICTIAKIHNQTSKRSRLRIMLRVLLDEPAGKRAIKESPRFSCAIGEMIGMHETYLYSSKQLNKRFNFFGKATLNDSDSVVHKAPHDNSSDAWLSSMVDAGWAYLNGVGSKVDPQVVKARHNEIAKHAPNYAGNYLERERVKEHYELIRQLYQKITDAKAHLQAEKNNPAANFTNLNSTIQEIIENIENDIPASQEETQEGARPVGAGVGRFFDEEPEDLVDQETEEINPPRINEEILKRIKADAIKRIRFEFHGFLSREKLQHNAKVTQLRAQEEAKLLSANEASKASMQEEPPQEADFTSIAQAVKTACNDIKEKLSAAIKNINGTQGPRCDRTDVERTHQAHIKKIELAATRSFNTLIEDSTSVISRIMTQSIQLDEQATLDTIVAARQTVIRSLEEAQNILQAIPENGPSNTRETAAPDKIKEKCLERLKTESVAHFNTLLEHEIRIRVESGIIEINALENTDEAALEAAVEACLRDIFSALNNLLLEENAHLPIAAAGNVLKDTKAVNRLIEAVDKKISLLPTDTASEDEFDQVLRSVDQSYSTDVLKIQRINLLTKFFVEELKKIKDVDKLVEVVQFAKYYLDASVQDKNEVVKAAEAKSHGRLAIYAARRTLTHYQPKLKDHTSDTFIELYQCAKIISALIRQVQPTNAAIKTIKKAFNRLVTKSYGGEENAISDTWQSRFIERVQTAICSIKESDSYDALEASKRKLDSLLNLVKKGQTKDVVGIALADSIPTLRDELRAAVTERKAQLSAQADRSISLDTLASCQQTLERAIEEVSRVRSGGNSKSRRLQEVGMTERINEHLQRYKEAYKQDLAVLEESDLSNPKHIFSQFKLAMEHLTSLKIPRKYIELQKARRKLASTMVKEVIRLALKTMHATLNRLRLSEEPKKLYSILLQSSEAIIRGVMSSEICDGYQDLFKPQVREAVSALLTEARAEAMLKAKPGTLHLNQRCWAHKMFVKDKGKGKDKGKDKDKDKGKDKYVADPNRHVTVLSDFTKILSYSSLSNEIKERLSDRLYLEVEISAFNYGLKARVPTWGSMEKAERRKAIKTYADYFIGIPKKEKNSLVKEALKRVEEEYPPSQDKRAEAIKRLNFRATLRAWAIEVNETRKKEDYPAALEPPKDLREKGKAEEAPANAILPEVVEGKIRCFLEDHGLSEDDNLYEETAKKILQRADQLVKDAQTVLKNSLKRWAKEVLKFEKQDFKEEVSGTTPFFDIESEKKVYSQTPEIVKREIKSALTTFGISLGESSFFMDTLSKIDSLLSDTKYELAKAALGQERLEGWSNEIAAKPEVISEVKSKIYVALCDLSERLDFRLTSSSPGSTEAALIPEDAEGLVSQLAAYVVEKADQVREVSYSDSDGDGSTLGGDSPFKHDTPGGGAASANPQGLFAQRVPEKRDQQGVQFSHEVTAGGR